jgi:hypothetical protein
MSNTVKSTTVDLFCQLAFARSGFYQFINSCKHGDNCFSLTPRGDVSPYAMCFAIFGYRLMRADDIIEKYRDIWDQKLREGLTMLQAKREREAQLSQDKPYLQLLTFTLSALSILGTLTRDPLADQVKSLLPSDLEASLNDAKVFQGAARSGNQAMFIGILLIYARDYLGLDTHRAIDCWVNLHLSAMNSFGFWGPSTSMSHLQFQNGYHQYELLEYLHSDDVPWYAAANAIASLADANGHFAPYPGGGGCYDYDAIFIITGMKETTVRHRELLMLTANSILSEQNKDGGFCESLRVRPRSLANISGSFLHAFNGRGRARTERLRSALTLLRPKHDRIHTHWSVYSREWSESDLWDSWFRMLTVARIDCALNPERANSWGFINFPGIGFHPSLREDY